MFEFVADEHVPVAVIEALRSNGYDVCRAQEEYGKGTNDTEVLEACADEDLVVLTNDNDFARLAEELEHSGVMIYNDQELPPREVVRAVVRVDNAYLDSLENQTVWPKAGSKTAPHPLRLSWRTRAYCITTILFPQF